MSVHRMAVMAMAVAIWLDAVPCGAGHVKWWQSEAIQATLALNSRQVDAIERIFELTSPKRLRLQRALDDLESALADAIDSGPDARVADLVSRVESARTAHNIARTMMLYRIYRVLTPEQRRKLKDVPDLDCGLSECTAGARARPLSLQP